MGIRGADACADGIGHTVYFAPRGDARALDVEAGSHGPSHGDGAVELRWRLERT